MSNIDDIFKKGLDGSGMEYSDASWASMEQMLGAKKVGFFARYKLLLGLGSMLLIGSIAFFYFNDLESDTVAHTPVVLGDDIASDAANVLGAKNELALADNAIKSETNDVVLDDRSNSTAAKSDASQAPTIAQEPKEIEKAIVDATSSKSNKQIKVNDRTINSSTSDGTFLDPIDNGFRIAEQPTTPMDENIAALSTRVTSEPLENDRADLMQVSSPSVSVPVISKPTAVLETLVKPEFEAAVMASSIAVSDFSYDLSAKNFTKLAFLPSPKGKKYGFYLSPYAGYVNYAKKAVLPENLFDEENNLGKSTAQNSYNYGFNVGVKKGKWMLTTGVGILSLKESTFYTLSNREYEYTTAPRISNSEFRYTPRGTRVALISQENIDSTFRESRVQLCEGCDVSFNYVSVPLNLQYNFGNKRLRYFAEAGLTASFLQNAQGNYTLPLRGSDSSDLVVLSIQDLNANEDVSKMLLQANAAVGAKFWLTPKWNLWSSYGYGMGLNSMLSSYEQKPTIQNLRVGVEFKLW